MREDRRRRRAPGRAVALPPGRVANRTGSRLCTVARTALAAGGLALLTACVVIPPPSPQRAAAKPPAGAATTQDIRTEARGQPARNRPTHTYVEATFEGVETLGRRHEERFHGFAAMGPSGGAEITLRSDSGAITCKGRSRVTKRPPGPGARGLEGEALVECSDGRLAIADYRYRTDTRGEGHGRDQYGARFTIRFMDVP